MRILQPRMLKEIYVCDYNTLTSPLHMFGVSKLSTPRTANLLLLMTTEQQEQQQKPKPNNGNR